MIVDFCASTNSGILRCIHHESMKNYRYFATSLQRSLGYLVSFHFDIHLLTSCSFTLDIFTDPRVSHFSRGYKFLRKFAEGNQRCRETPESVVAAFKLKSKPNLLLSLRLESRATSALLFPSASSLQTLSILQHGEKTNSLVSPGN